MKRTISVVATMVFVCLNLEAQRHTQSALHEPFRTVARILSDEPVIVDDELHHKCGTPMLAQLTLEWERLGIAARRELSDVLQRPEKQRSRISPSGRFRIHYDTTGFHAPALLWHAQQRLEGTHEAYVDSVAKYFDDAWRKQVDELRYDPPPPDGMLGGGPEYDVYISNLAGGLFGYTEWDPDQPLDSGPRRRFATWITIDNDFLGLRTPGMDGLRITAAHEFFHAIQVGAYGIWTNTTNSDFYFYELTSVWMEKVLHPDVNDYYFDVPRFFREFRDIQGRSYSFTHFDAFLYAGYERSVWAHFLDRRFGRDLIRETWERMKTEPYLKSIDGALRSRGTDLVSAFATFAHWNYFTADRADPDRYYPEGHFYPRFRPNRSLAFEGFNVATVSHEARPLSLQMAEFRTMSDTINAVVANVDLAGAAHARDALSPYELRLSQQAVDIPYRFVGSGLRMGFGVSRGDDWRTVYLSARTGQSLSLVAEIAPNPIHLARSSRVIIPLDCSPGTPAQVLLYSASLDRRFDRQYSVEEELGQRMIQISVADFADYVSSGVYFVVVVCEGREFRWKVAIIR